MQFQFEEDDYNKYAHDDKNYKFPDPPDICPVCKRHVSMKKYGFYHRYFITSGFCKKICIRRYICPECGHTVSFLPYFCIPYFQYDINLIMHYLREVIKKKGTLKACLDDLKKIYADIQIYRQHILFYLKRFTANIIPIQYGLRQIIPDTDFMDAEKDKKERARELIEIILNGFESARIFAKRFRDNCNRTFLASLTLY